MDYILASWPHQPEVGSYGIFRPPLHSQKKSDAFGDSISFDSSFSQGFFPLVLTAALFFPLSLFVDQTDTVQPQNLLVVTFLLLFIARARGVQSYTVVWHHPQAKRLQPFQPPPPPFLSKDMEPGPGDQARKWQTAGCWGHTQRGAHV